MVRMSATSSLVEGSSSTIRIRGGLACTLSLQTDLSPFGPSRLSEGKIGGERLAQAAGPRLLEHPDCQRHVLHGCAHRLEQGDLRGISAARRAPDHQVSK